MSLSGLRKLFSRELLLVFLIFCLVAVFHFAGTLEYLNGKLFDVLVTFHRSKPVHRDNVVFVCIDQKSIDYFADQNIGWPWPREFHRPLVDYLAGCGAKAVVFDVIFSEQDIDRFAIGGDGEASDDEFAAAIDRSGITYLAVAAQDEVLSEIRYPDAPLFLSEHTDAYLKAPDVATFKSAVFPLKKFQDGARGLGLANLVPEADGIHRRYSIVSTLDGRYVPSLAYAVVMNILDDAAQKHILDNFGENTFIDSEGKFLLNWYGDGGTGRNDDNPETDAVFNYYSYHAVIFSAIQEERGDEPILPPETFKDKVIIVGSNAAGLFDLKATPFTHQNIYPGMEIHATAIENMLSNDFINRIPVWTLIGVMAVISIGLYGIDRFFKSLRIFIAVSVVLLTLETVVSYACFIAGSMWISTAEMLGTTTLVFLSLVISGYFKETKEKRVLRRSFGQYVNETVLQDILANPASVDFQGRIIHATIMATDIAGFTSISEQLEPQEVVTRLNDYLSEVSEALIDNGAFINKYIGDAILALYGAFEEPDHQRKACRAAIFARDIIRRKVQQAESEQQMPFVTRFGITTGGMTMGNIGSERKIEYTVIGDTVNTAFRFEGLNKFYKTTIIVGDTTKDETGDEFEFRLLDILKVKGKKKPEQVFELIGLKGEVPPEIIRRRDDFDEALKLYQTKRFEEAMSIFERLEKEGDKTSDVFVYRCRKFIEEPPPPDWNGVWVMLRK